MLLLSSITYLGVLQPSHDCGGSGAGAAPGPRLPAENKAHDEERRRGGRDRDRDRDRREALHIGISDLRKEIVRHCNQLFVYHVSIIIIISGTCDDRACHSFGQSRQLTLLHTCMEVIDMML